MSSVQYAGCKAQVRNIITFFSLSISLANYELAKAIPVPVEVTLLLLPSMMMMCSSSTYNKRIWIRTHTYCNSISNCTVYTQLAGVFVLHLASRKTHWCLLFFFFNFVPRPALLSSYSVCTWVGGLWYSQQKPSKCYSKFCGLIQTYLCNSAATTKSLFFHMLTNIKFSDTTTGSNKRI